MSLEERLHVWSLARELAEALEESDELQAFRQTEDTVLADDEALELIREFEVAKRALNKAKKAPIEEQMLLAERFMQIEERFNAHRAIQAYWAARTNLDALMQRINAIVTAPITGEEAPPDRSEGEGGAI